MSARLIQRIFAHLEWADERALDALRRAGAPPPQAVELFAHILGADLNWLARVQGAAPRAAVWPTQTVADCGTMMAESHAGWRAYLATLTDAELARNIHYRNSAGLEFDSSVEEILLQVALHAVYHRGQVSTLLRSAGLEPNPTDFIAFARGAPAATRHQR